MAFEPVKVTIDATVSKKSPSFGDSSTVTVKIRHYRETQEVEVNETEGTSSTLRSYPSSSPSLPDSEFSLQFQNFEPDFVYQNLNNRLHDHVLSRKVSDEIVVKALNRSQDGPLFMVIYVTVTQKEFIVVPCRLTATDLKAETCSICLENLEFGSETKSVCQLRNCPHSFHEECIVQWLNRRHNSCPLCRQTV